MRFPIGNEGPGNITLGLEDDASNGVGTGSETIVDVTQSLESTNLGGIIIENSGESILAHELLGHGFDKDKGTLDRTLNEDMRQMRHEESAMRAENECKTAIDEILRNCHSDCN